MRVRSLTVRSVALAAAAVGVLAMGAVLTAPGAAEAVTACQTVDNTRFCSFGGPAYEDGVTVAIEWTPRVTQVLGRLTNDGIWTLETSTIYVQQCDVRLTRCDTIAANSEDNLTFDYTTSLKPTSGGHVYRACASWKSTSGWTMVNRCSPFIARSS